MFPVLAVRRQVLPCTQGLGGVLNAVQLSFHAAYAVLQQPASASSPAAAPEAAHPPAADSIGNLTADLGKFNSMDLYFTMVRLHHGCSSAVCRCIRTPWPTNRTVNLLCPWRAECVLCTPLRMLQAVQKDARLRAPLNADLLDLTTSFLTAKLQSVGSSPPYSCVAQARISVAVVFAMMECSVLGWCRCPPGSECDS